MELVLWGVRSAAVLLCHVLSAQHALPAQSYCFHRRSACHAPLLLSPPLGLPLTAVPQAG